MKKTKKLVPQVLLRRMILVLLDAAIVIFSFYFALLLRADGAVEASAATRDVAIDLVRAYQARETHFMLKANFSIIEGVEEHISYK